MMATMAAPAMSTYELPLPARSRLAPSTRDASARDAAGASRLPESLLVRNVVWFCQLRWIVVAILAAFGLAGLAPGLLPRLGLQPHRDWPFVAATFLTAANLGFLAHARFMARSAASQGAGANLCAQIVVDLLVLTVVVHYMGSLETYVAFAYLFHIVLACIFFPGSWSFAVTALAAGLYVACVALEETGVLPAAGIYAGTALRDMMDRMPGLRLLNVSWAIVTWVAVWYLASTLSAMVRRRDGELAETNRRLLAAQEEKTRHMLRTTHELKAPFAAVHANVQLLLKGHCGPMGQEAQDVLQRIATRCRRLAHEIQEMLQLANLTSAREEALAWTEVDLAELVRWAAAQARPAAQEREIRIEEDIRPARTVAVEDHLKMALANVLSNAVTYSRPGGSVELRCEPAPDGGAVVTVADRGIGIAGDKLPRIFETYYRTNEAVQHNRESTGLGLAIVRHVAETHGIRVQARSAPGVGTTFILTFPSGAGRPGHHGEGKEGNHGLPDDRG